MNNKSGLQQDTIDNKVERSYNARDILAISAGAIGAVLDLASSYYTGTDPLETAYSVKFAGAGYYVGSVIDYVR